MIEAARTSETSVNINLTTRRYIPEDLEHYFKILPRLLPIRTEIKTEKLGRLTSLSQKRQHINRCLAHLNRNQQNPEEESTNITNTE
jgi:hypothetical protein